MKRIKIATEGQQPHGGIWPLVGIVEELRSAGVSIPERLNALAREVLLNINIPRFVRGVYPGRREEMLEILEGLDAPDYLPDSYLGPEDGAISTASGRLGVHVCREFLKDRLLGVGLKAYPYVVDWNGNGKKDLLIGDHDGFIYLYLNEGTDEAPVFGLPRRVKAVDTGDPLIVQYNPKIGLADFRGIGVRDLVLGNYGGQVAYLPNRARDGRFEFALGDLTYLRCLSGTIDVENYAYPEAVDWNDNGFADLLVGQVEGKVLLFLNTCRQDELLFHEGIELQGLDKVMYPHPVAIDWNDNGVKDLLLGHRDGTVLIYLNVGTNAAPRFVKSGEARKEDGRPIEVGFLSHPCVVDWDNDGKKDLLIGNDPGQVSVFRNVGSDADPVFAEGEMLKDGGGELICGVHPIFVPVDWDGNGSLDLLVGHQEQVLRLFRNEGSRTSPAFDSFEIVQDVIVSADELADDETAPYWELDGLEFDTEYLGNLAPCPVDWHNSGRLDLLVGNYTGLIYLFENVGTRAEPRFGGGTPLRLGRRPLRVAGFSTPVVVDWNNNGKKDLVCGDLLGRIHVFLNVGTDENPVFEQDEMIEIEGRPVMLPPRSIIEVADIDGDGRKDLLVGNRFGGVYALLNDGSDAQPAFNRVEQLEDASDIWKQLYNGLQHPQVADNLRRIWKRLPDSDHPGSMSVLETSCPRFVDWDGDGEKELLISQRYGRIFVFRRQAPRAPGASIPTAGRGAE